MAHGLQVTRTETRLAGLALVMGAAVWCVTCAVQADDRRPSSIPDWAVDAIFYQIFPERFANGDRSNDPTRESLEFPDIVPKSWCVTPWTSDWYARADWERAMGDDFYADGVFHRRYGGDLAGVLAKLDYLQDLGINAIYFNPVFYARSLHKYDGNSFHHVDPYFGPDPAGDFELMARETSDPATWHWTAADKLFLEVVREAHARGIRVILDGVFNHTGRDFFAFADLRQRQADSPYKDWYIVTSFDDPETPRNEFVYKGWWDVDTLPEFANNTAGDDLHPGPKVYIFDITRRWMDPDGDGDPSDGIDGWRLDVAEEVPLPFWTQWNRLVREINPQAYTVSEIWGDAHHFLHEGGFSATMNYYGFAFPVKGFFVDNVLSPSEVAYELHHRRTAYPPAMQRAMQNLVDSHDTDRLASMIVSAGPQPYLEPARFDYDTNGRVSPRHWPDYPVRKPTERERRIQRLVATFQMVYVGAPMVYYGTEAGMWGADDPCDRMPMVWPEFEYEPQTSHPLGRDRPADSVEFDTRLHDFYRRAIRLRRNHAALRRGEIEFLPTRKESRLLALRRWDDQESLFVALNRGEAAFQWHVPLDEGESLECVFTASGDPCEVRYHGPRALVAVPGLDAAVLKVQPNSRVVKKPALTPARN